MVLGDPPQKGCLTPKGVLAHWLRIVALKGPVTALSLVVLLEGRKLLFSRYMKDRIAKRQEIFTLTLVSIWKHIEDYNDYMPKIERQERTCMLRP